MCVCCLFFGRRKLLEIWKEGVKKKSGYQVLPTYGLLLEKCLQGGDSKTAEAICKLIQQG